MTSSPVVGKWLTAALILCCWLLASMPATPRPDTNGCGPEDFGLIFPELWFEEACDQHDLCFASGQDKHLCNKIFLKEMLEACQNIQSLKTFSATRLICQQMAKLYFLGVELAN